VKTRTYVVTIAVSDLDEDLFGNMPEFITNRLDTGAISVNSVRMTDNQQFGQNLASASTSTKRLSPTEVDAKWPIGITYPNAATRDVINHRLHEGRRISAITAYRDYMGKTLEYGTVTLIGCKNDIECIAGALYPTMYPMWANRCRMDKHAHS